MARRLGSLAGAALTAALCLGGCSSSASPTGSAATATPSASRSDAPQSASTPQDRAACEQMDRLVIKMTSVASRWQRTDERSNRATSSAVRRLATAMTAAGNEATTAAVRDGLRGNGAAYLGLAEAIDQADPTRISQTIRKTQGRYTAYKRVCRQG
jgi:hypothetical protein